MTVICLGVPKRSTSNPSPFREPIAPHAPPFQRMPAEIRHVPFLFLIRQIEMEDKCQCDGSMRKRQRYARVDA
jgi:hypothetical protein